MDKSFQDNFLMTPRQSASTPRGAKYSAKPMAVTPLPAHSDQSFSQDGVIPSPSEAEAFFRMKPMIVDSHLTTMGMSLDAALELRNGDKYPEPDMGRIGHHSSRFSGRHAFQPLNSFIGQRAKAPVASPEKFSPQKKKQRNSPENVLESSDGNASFVPKRTVMSTFMPSSLHFVTGNSSSTPRQNIPYVDHNVTASTNHSSPATAMSSSSSSHTPTPSQHNKSPSPHTMTQGNSSPLQPTYTEGLPQTHSRATLAVGKNRLSDGMLIYKFQQAQRERDSVTPDFSKPTASNQYPAQNTRSSFTYMANSSNNVHRERHGGSQIPNKSSDLDMNLAQRALLSPRFEHTPMDKIRSPLQQASPSQRALLSPRFDQVQNLGRENREPPGYQKYTGNVLTSKTNHQIVGAVSQSSPLREGSSVPAPTRYYSPNVMPPSSLPVTSLAPQSNVFQNSSSKHFSSSLLPASKVQEEETVTFV